MEYSEREEFCGSGEGELDPDIVSEEAGKLYSELQSVVEAHGEAVVESLVPMFVWVLEALASCRGQLRDREEEAEREKAEREELMDRYHVEKALRKESQERYLELDDQIEQERRATKAREKGREQRERELERKAREQADQVVFLEEQKSHLGRELNTLRHSHNKLLIPYRDLLEKTKDSDRDSPSRFQRRLKVGDPCSNQVLVELCADDKPDTHRPHSLSAPPTVEPQEGGAVDVKLTAGQFVDDIISSTPELAQFHVDTSSPRGPPHTEAPTENSLEEELKMLEEKETGEKKEEEEEEEEEEDSLVWELRNTDSVFSELSELSPDYLESVDRGVSVRGNADMLEEILSQYEELKVTHESVDVARKALISRVVELTDERSALQRELTSVQETVARAEGRMKEKEDEAKRLRRELESHRVDDPDASSLSSTRHFSRSEMARVVMEKNQYKQRLFELQEAVRHSQTVRATKEELKLTEEKRQSVWRRFNRLIGLSKEPLLPRPASTFTSSAAAPLRRPPVRAQQSAAVSQTQAESALPAALSPRLRRRELYKEIRTHVWGNLGKRQIHGWSMPLGGTQECGGEPAPEPRDVPVLMQLRLLDHRDSTAKINCAVSVPPDVSGEPTCSVWIISGPASSSDITVIDPARSNSLLDQFSLPPTAAALCLCAVPPVGGTTGTVWIGTQEGSVLVHSASADRRRCLQSSSLSEGVYSLTYSHGHVVAGLADSSLAFFSHSSGGWNLQPHTVLPLGSNPLQPLRCCLAKDGRLWVGCWNKVHVVDLTGRKVEQTFQVSERCEQQVRFLCAGGTGVWTSCRLDPVLRLFDRFTGRPLQEVDFSVVVMKTLGQDFLALSSFQISSLTIISTRLWVGTGGGAVFSIPLSISQSLCVCSAEPASSGPDVPPSPSTASEAVSIPYCSTSSAQLCYHGHRQAVRFIIAAPGCLMTSPGSRTVTAAQLVLSGGEGYVNFRIGDDEDEASEELSQATPQRSERSHMIIWQNHTSAVPSPAL
ncbi:C-Jun-amino-terminal kinase-interacting protein 4 isoform X2 [Cynoglossus semilaevis]|uniref:C-Jun-amino-terminal kinase-interacting protein 4 isoform X2 n=1 Tax=Cynoglossus semilaevis TaxID=244447 RepID=UPI000D62B0BA|nr:C-Jun-amino-terminal kinase-interacting protein 4-like isoform X2 [Cynoglossus semilaevis]